MYVNYDCVYSKFKLSSNAYNNVVRDVLVTINYWYSGNVTVTHIIFALFVIKEANVFRIPVESLSISRRYMSALDTLKFPN